MREIKFRAWSKVSNMFLDITGFETEKGRVYGLFHDGDYIGYDKEDIHLMQYTGLKDKNGKEIYEGDILEFSGNVVALGIVKYNENFATFQACNGNSGWLFGNENGTNIEILGNSYENPELLKTK